MSSKRPDNQNPGPAGAPDPEEAHRPKYNGKLYSKDFKIAAVKLVTEQGCTPKEAALSLGVAISILQNWIKLYAHNPQQEAETIETLRLRNKQLEAENQRLKQDQEILKKARSFFANQ